MLYFTLIIVNVQDISEETVLHANLLGWCIEFVS